MKDWRPIVVNLGCRLNSYETSYISTIMKSLDMQDFALVNTCTITNESEKKSRKEVRKLKKENPNKKILVTGCASELHSDYFSKMPEVDFVIGNDLKKNKEIYNKINSFFKKNFQKIEDFQKAKEELQKTFLLKNKKIFSEDIFDIDTFQKESRTRAFIEIQNGCNHYCSFCIVPFVRGKMQSRSTSEIINEINELERTGYKEVVLTGVDITDYGTDISNSRQLSSLCRLILKETKIKRLRLSSVDVAEIDTDLIEIFRNEPRFMPYFHISLQSGNNNTLKKMRRRHKREDVYNFINKIHSIRKDVGIGADIIAGFGNETLEEFEDSLKIIKECDINFIHAFPYSKKEKTLASSWEDNIEKSEKKRRVNEMIELGKINLHNLMRKMLNTEQTIILEIGEKSGKAENFIDIFVNNEEGIFQAGDLLNVKCTSFKDGKLFGEIINEKK